MTSQIFVLGLSWRTAPVAVRETVAFPAADVSAALADVRGHPDIAEVLILSTCNRVEICGATPRGAGDGADARALSAVRAFLARSRGVGPGLLAEHLYEHRGASAIRHVLRVASSLDSMVIGEPQILGQLKEAYRVAAGAGATGPVLGRCMDRAFSVAKRVRTETGISRGAANVSSVAVELARHVFGDLRGKSVLLVGAGKMSALAARHLRADGAGRIVVTNRSAERARSLAAQIEADAAPWDDLFALVAAADVVISSTGAANPILSRKLIKRAIKTRRQRPLIIVDIAVPRDVEPAAGNLDGVYVFDIDDLQRLVAENLKEREREADQAERIITAEVAAIESAIAAERAVPTIRALRARFVDVARAEAQKAAHHIAGAASVEARAEAVHKLADRIAKKLLHAPMRALSGASAHDPEDLAVAVKALFDLSAEAEAEADGGDDPESGQSGAPPKADPESEPEPENQPAADPEAAPGDPVQPNPRKASSA
ncbi:MAG TPA: glutamyl-tRNA reductase [Kofleriaceae bacterium]|nr:glutamyl-tRNA reductase [Kofleriaceae bacterium]